MILSDPITRRSFVGTSFAALAATTTSALAQSTPAKLKTVRAGFIGVGARGNLLLLNSLDVIPNFEVPAVCDINAAAADVAAAAVIKKTGKQCTTYTDGEDAWEKMIKRDDLDVVIIATPWKWHVPMAIAAMEHNIIAGIEVPCALSIEDCWKLVDTTEKTKVPCMMLENWSFRSDNLALLNMVRKGMFGDIVHVHSAHSHDCIDHWFFDPSGNDLWPAEYLVKYNRDQYPCHSLGPVLSWCDIHCGDRFTSVTSTATGSFGINDYFARRFGKDHPGAKREYAQGDIVTSTLKTTNGKTVVVNYDMQLPRPYDNRWMLQGTRGVYNEQRNALYLVRHSPGYHQWEPFPPYNEKYQHKFWAQGGAGGHGGVDSVMLREFFEAIRDKRPLPLTVYDSVAMSALIDLSGQSIANNSAPVEFPDFTRGNWNNPENRFAVDMT